MPNEKSVSVRISTTGYEDAKLKIDKLKVSADALGREHPTITPEINKAKVLLEARLLRDGIKKELSGSLMSGGASGGLLAASGLGGAGGKGFFSGLDSLPFGGLAGITALIPVIEAVVVEAGALVSGLAAAAAGVGAFGVLAIPTLKNIATAYTGISAAQKKYNDAVELQKADPTKTHAKEVAAALTQLKIAQKDMSPSTRAAVTGIQDLMKAYDSMAKAFAPDVLKVFNDGLKIANNLLPALKPFATAASGALDGLLKQFGKFTQSSGFKDWLGQFSKLAGPSITAIGQGIGRVVTNLGKLFTSFSAKDVTHAINVAFDIISGSIKALTWVVTHLMHSWDQLSSGMVKFAQVVGPPILDFIKIAVGSLKILADVALAAFGSIIDSAALAFGWIPGIGPKLKTAAKAFDGFRKSVDDNLNTARKNLAQWGTDLTNMPKIVKIKGNIDDIKEKLKQAKAQLADPAFKGETAQIKANISQLTQQLAAARAELARLNGTTATTYIKTVRIGGPVPLPGTIPHRAAGGWASGPTLINELGPEVVDLPSGSYVHTAAQSRQMLGGNTYNINVGVLPGSEHEAGRIIVGKIREFEKRSGKGWRK